MICKHLKDERISESVDEDKDGTFAINGCCGGGCYVISGIAFCPFCGIKISVIPDCNANGKRHVPKEGRVGNGHECTVCGKCYEDG